MLDRLRPARRPRVLVVDVGGTHVKALVTGETTPVRIRSGPGMTPLEMVTGIREAVGAWRYDVVSLGLPTPVVDGRSVAEPHNLGEGWMGFDFEQHFERPVRLINDAAMQALGGYAGGRMLFLGLGTGLGSALVVEGHVQPLELAHLPYRKGHSYEDYVGEAGRKRFGKRRWRRFVIDVTRRLVTGMQTDALLIGGGNARRLRKCLHHLPPNTRLGSNEDAFQGGFRLWMAPEDRALTFAPVVDDTPPTADVPPVSDAAPDK